MEQLQSLLTHMAVGLQRLDADLSAEQPEAPSAKEQARRTTLRIATAANRCSWCSVCELACYITTGALARKTHIPIAIFLSRPMFMLQECRLLLQHGDQMLLDAPDVQHDHVRAVDALAFTAVVAASRPPQPASSSAAEMAGAPSSSNAQSSAAQPVLCESEAEDLSDDSVDPAQRNELPADTVAGEVAEDVNDITDDLEITTLTNTTSLHDDWLHRGPFLADLDLHTCVAHVVRIPQPTKARLSDTQRFQDVFLFDDHYELAKTHWQQLKTRGFHVLLML